MRKGTMREDWRIRKEAMRRRLAGSYRHWFLSDTKRCASQSCRSTLLAVVALFCRHSKTPAPWRSLPKGISLGCWVASD